MKKKILLLSTTLMLSFSTYAQYNETIDSGRPGNAISVLTVGKNIGQIETGVSFSDNDESYTSNTFLRYGITDRIEINGGGSYLLTETDKMTSGLTSYNLGAKFNIFEGNNMMPSTAFYVGATIPAENLKEEKAFSSFLFIMNYSLNEKFSYTLNFGVNLDLESRIIPEKDSEGVIVDVKRTYFEGVYVFNLLYSLNHKWSFFVEPYGSFNRYLPPKIKVNVNAGFSYLVNNDFQLDFLAGHGVNSNEYVTLSAGLSWRLDFR